MSWIEDRLKRVRLAQVASRGTVAQALSSGYSTQDLWEGRIQKSAGICGGRARITETRIPVWLLVSRVIGGASLNQVADEYPSVSALDVELAMHYFAVNPTEILADLHENEVEGFGHIDPARQEENAL